MPDKHWGEEVCLCVRPENGWQDLDALREALLARLKKQLAHYKVPKYFVFMEDFPRTTTGKIRTSELLAKAQEMLQL